MIKKISYLLIILLALLVSSLACQVSYSLPFDSARASQPTASPQFIIKTATLTSLQQLPDPEDIQLIESRDEVLVALYKRVNPSVVLIQTLTDYGQGAGSGFLYDNLGHIVTNYHVIEGATDIEVHFPTGVKTRGIVIATDLDSDLAVVKVDPVPAGISPLPLGDSDLLQVGQTVIAIGNPFGLDSTMTVGIVSAKGRTLASFRESPDGGVFSAGDLIQTDAAINPGNSGGPLLNLNGEVVGINRAIQTRSSLYETPANSGVAFTISSNIIRRVVPSLIEKGSYDYPYLGVVAKEELTLLEQEALGITHPVGAYVIQATTNGPAQKAGVRGGTINSSIPGLPLGGDLIIAVDGQPVRVFADLLAYLMKQKSPGESITLTIIRDNQQQEVQITLEKRP
jgi:2-alkenal reductase